MDDLVSRQKVLRCIKESRENIDWGQSKDGDAFLHYSAALYRTIASKECLPSAQRWIPCSERLPKEYKVVLITSFRKARTFNQIPYLRMAYYCDSFWYPIPQDNTMFPQKIEDFDGGEPCVTAWMPLPEPWKG